MAMSLFPFRQSGCPAASESEEGVHQEGPCESWCGCPLHEAIRFLHSCTYLLHHGYPQPVRWMSSVHFGIMSIAVTVITLW